MDTKRICSHPLLVFSALLGACTMLTMCSCGQDDEVAKKEQDQGVAKSTDLGALEMSVADMSSMTPKDMQTDLGHEMGPQVPVFPKKVEAKRAWSTYTFCPESWKAPDFLTGHDVFVHASPKDSAKPLVSLNLKVPLSAGGYPTAVALATLDVETGEPLPCHKLPVQDAVTSDLTHFDPQRRVSFYAYHNDELEGGDPGPGGPDSLVNGIVGVQVDTGDVVLDHAESRQAQSDIPKAIALAFGRSQIVATPGMNRLVSLDAKTGEVLWRLDAQTLGMSSQKELAILDLMTPTSKRLFFIDQGPRLFELTPKGVPMLRHDMGDSGVIVGPIFFEDGVVLEEFKNKASTVKVFDDLGGTLLHEEKACGRVFSMSPERVGCTERTNQSQQLRIVSMALDGSSRRERVISVPDELDRTIQSGVIALSSRHVLVTMTGSRPHPDPKRVLPLALMDLYIVDMEDEKRPPVHLEISKDEKTPGESFITTPLFTKNGMLIIPRWGSLQGIQTNIPWTDRGPAPRGARIGNHFNSGYTTK